MQISLMFKLVTQIHRCLYESDFRYTLTTDHFCPRNFTNGSSTMTPVLPQGSDQDEDTTELWSILFRRQQLQNRLQFLQEIQRKNNRIEGYLANEEGPTELDRIKEELKLLEQKEKDLIQKKKQCLTTQTTDKDSVGGGQAKKGNRETKRETENRKGKKERYPIQAPIQGLYILPVSVETISPIIALQEENTEAISPSIARQEENTDTPVSLDDVTMSPAKVKCPSCQKTVITEIYYKLGSNAFLFCCLLSVIGCLAGCCLVPFCMNRFKDVAHRCPSCHKDICSVNRF
ncbi:uncharacterized protein LOC131550739 isoform X2 [Onychostoma macrolepis]|uniref:uncharacterized protein LOC131550739 isoform X2 n=1 Tax=Onychostoma macrolepis TaxID=369639 RepID=UPI00272B4CE9|nr:uncharacterized protein LOC131550739 isoform X2 [Onychostoma macrolepis]